MLTHGGHGSDAGQSSPALTATAAAVHWVTSQALQGCRSRDVGCPTRHAARRCGRRCDRTRPKTSAAGTAPRLCQQSGERCQKLALQQWTLARCRRRQRWWRWQTLTVGPAELRRPGCCHQEPKSCGPALPGVARRCLRFPDRPSAPALTLQTNALVMTDTGSKRRVCGCEKFAQSHMWSWASRCETLAFEQQQDLPGIGGGGAIAFAADRRKPPNRDRLAGLGSPAASSDTACLAGEAWPAVFAPAPQQELERRWHCKPEDHVVSVLQPDRGRPQQALRA